MALSRPPNPRGGKLVIAPAGAIWCNYGVTDGDAPVDVPDSSGLVAAVASGETVGLGAAVSVFRSQATSNATPAKMQMYLFIDLNRFYRPQNGGVLNEECPHARGTVRKRVTGDLAAS